jgi:3-methyladenine DNA glycosylase/8-oxoguanine DNA glycosylase
MATVEATFSLATPSNFSFWRTVFSHGWCELLPFSVSAERQELERTLMLPRNVPVHCVLREEGKNIAVTVRGRRSLTAAHLRHAAARLRACLRLDEDFGPFHNEAKRYPEFRWMCETGSGRLLRAPTVFEDAVKMLLTTNCTWRLTTIMVRNLTHLVGEQFDETHWTFPGPEAIASLSERTLRTRIKTGYRSPFLLRMARDNAEGKLDMESWRTSPLHTAELYEEIRKVKGLGPYAAGNLLRLLGRCDYLALDTWVRQQYFKIHRKGRIVKDTTIERHYQKFGVWKGLIFWLEMTKEWHDEGGNAPIG